MFSIKKRILFFVFISCHYFFYAQSNKADSSLFIPLVKITYSFQVPGGDLAKRFGNNSSIGIAFIAKTKKNWLWGADWNYLFGNQVKEDGILDSIATESGLIINKNGEYADIKLYERGFLTNLKGGLLLPFLKINSNSGPMLLGSIGLLQHKIRIQDNGNTAPQLQGDYKKGYDRLSNGIAFSEFIGYLYLSKKKLINFYAGVELSQAYTQSRRSYDYDLRKQDTQKRKDYLYSIKFGWILPLYRKSANQFYYY